jgi:Myc proto-oncogene protein
MQQQLELTMNQPEYMGDHSYTRPKSRYDLVGLGVQTPSDSEEEIDVVSVGEKTLPTNPSARDRRQLQTTVANKIRSKNQTQRRRCSDDDLSVSSLSPLSSQGTTPTKNYVSNILSSYSNNTSTTSRKRQIHKDTNNNENNDSTTPNVKRYKSSNINNNNNNNNNNSNNSSNSSSTKKRASNAKSKSDTDELETIEKRNLHNNMERQRRIGLKNLFEELKQQIPSLKDKERAPKVNILREAATYCTKLRTDDELYAELWKKNQRLVARINNLKKSMGPLAHHVLAQRKYT